MPTQLDPPFSTKADVTLTNANQAYEIQPSSRTVKLSVFFVTNAGFIGHTGTEGVTLAAAVKTPVDADRWFEVSVKGSHIFLESASAGTVAYVIAEQ